MKSGVTNSLIDAVLKNIARRYKSGALAEIRQNRPKQWGKLMIQEARINRAALDGDLSGLRKVLEAYQKLILSR